MDSISGTSKDIIPCCSTLGPLPCGEHTEDEREHVIFVVLFIHTPISSITEGLLMRNKTTRQSCERDGANTIHLTKPLNDPAQTSRDLEKRKMSGGGSCGGSGGEGGVRQRGHCVMSALVD